VVNIQRKLEKIVPTFFFFAVGVIKALLLTSNTFFQKFFLQHSFEENENQFL